MFMAKKTILRAGKMTFCPVKPYYNKNDNEFTATYSCKPTETIMKNDKIQFIECLLDQNHLSIPIINISGDDIIFDENKKIGLAREVQEELLPIMDTDLTVSNSEVYAINSTTYNNNREKEVANFNREMESYPAHQANFLRQYRDIFIPDDPHILPALNIPPVKLQTKHEQIIPTPSPTRRNFTKQDEELIDTFIEASMLNTLIRRCESETVSPMHVVKHTDKKPRIVLDLRLVNKYNAAVFNYNYPHIEKEVQDLASQNYKYYFSADATAAFNQIPLDEKSQKLLAFNCPTDKNKGVYCYTRLAFGWTSAPSIFASTLDYILHGINQPHSNWKVKTFIDDIAGGAQSYLQMEKLLRAFFTRLRRYNLKLSISKSKFFKDSVEFCGLKITQNGYKMSDKRMKILKSYPDFDVSKMKKKGDLSLYGFYNYHRSFVKDYSSKDQLIRQTVKDWENKKISSNLANAKIKSVTDYYKKQIMNTILVMPSKQDDIILETDSSGKSFGGILYCKRGIIAYFGSNHPISRQSSHNIYELELASLAYCIKKSFNYLTQCRSVCIKNDNISAIFSSNSIKTKLTSRVLKYLGMIQTLLSDIDSKIVHIKGSANNMADLLSRLNYDNDGYIILSDRSKIEVSTINKEEVSKTEDDNQQIEDKEMLEHLHDKTHWTPLQTQKVLKSIGKLVSYDLILDVWRQCKNCGKYKKIAPYSKLSAHETASMPLEKIHIDHIDFKNNKSSRLHTGIFTARCDLTRFVFCFPVKNLGVQDVCLHLSTIMAITGRKIHSIYADNAFDAVYLKEFCARENIKIEFRPAYSSRSVIVERAHRDIHEYLRRFDAGRNWDQFIYKVTRSMNDAICDSTGFSPRYLMYGNANIYNDEYSMQSNQLYENDLEIAKAVSDLKRKNENFIFRKINPGTPVMIRKDGHKNTKMLFGEVMKDDGGASITVKLDSGREYIYSKGHVHLIKGSDEYDRVFDPGKISKMIKVEYIGNDFKRRGES